ncbi:microsomal glutathione S-transferase 1-like [Chrysoperla carnea]|uniref:microsomal glutathione S-transferase 1-like n=1 Tax=Chrysoperla carnea TaxID=189513 RepID=UPI001D083540|nr:microsomal glutathione S-transferase 1-like [Chrysoperla carnea]
MASTSSNITIIELLSYENPVLRAYIFYTCLLVLKILAMLFLIVPKRFQKKIFISPEDTVLRKGSVADTTDPDIERCRRAHLNDLESIPAFLFVAFFYVLTNPMEFLAINLFRLFTLARFIHTFVYAVIVIPQPTRAIVWGIGYIITIYIAVATAIHFI